MIKISILLLYVRVFQSTWLRKVSKIMLGVVVVLSLWTVGSHIFGCIPVHGFWDVTANATCLPRYTWYIGAGINIITDFAIFFMPLTVVRAMRLPTRKKVGLYAVFALGFLSVLIPILSAYPVRPCPWPSPPD